MKGQVNDEKIKRGDTPRGRIQLRHQDQNKVERRCAVEKNEEKIEKKRKVIKEANVCK